MADQSHEWNPTGMERMARVRVVLARPLIAGNIGSIARAMENFNAGSLYLVAPKANHLATESLQRSTRGEHRLHSAQVVSELHEALAGTVQVIGASRRSGPAHQADDLTPRQMAQLVQRQIAYGDVALLFGTEDNGLSREEMLACDAIVRIPAQEAYPTFNLAHAAVICLYEVFLAIVDPQAPVCPPDLRSEPADRAMMDRLMTKLQHALLTIGYLRPEKPDHLMFPIRHIFSRANLTRAEAQILMGLAQQIDEFSRYGK